MQAAVVVVPVRTELEPGTWDAVAAAGGGDGGETGLGDGGGAREVFSPAVYKGGYGALISTAELLEPGRFSQCSQQQLEQQRQQRQQRQQQEVEEMEEMEVTVAVLAADVLFAA
ncbi:hypothetical protein AXG93_2654s1040 [Marchantia polymorpha subsp. ruderalis]|uniref:Uncharacterized protein n=1 Tax=Marchantia polymorpha subsp. ruderalis TaxID=1480154 RepID=A0A176W1P9_MARPO|nr:hypothetical protein AXG93_2654s1040 [Marchantia polymorpha subsp. ruderalis]